MSYAITVFGQNFRIPDRAQTSAGFHLGPFLAALATDGAIKNLTASANLIGSTSVTTLGDIGSLITNAGAAASINVTLPTSAPAGAVYQVLVTTAQNVVVKAPTGKLNAAGTGNQAKSQATLAGLGTSLTVVCVDGTNWWITAQNVATGATITLAP